MDDPNSPLIRLEQCRANGFGFGEALAVLDTMTLNSEKGWAKYSIGGARHANGVDLTKVANFGGLVEVPTDHAATHDRNLKLWAVRETITPDVITVFEIGSGHGELIVSLARENQGLPKRFIASDIHLQKLACVDTLAEIGRVSVETRVFDAAAPDFGFLPKDGHLVILANAVLNQFPGDTVRAFFEAARTLPNLKALCIFDVLEARLDEIFPGIEIMPTYKPWGAWTGLVEGLLTLRGFKVARGIPYLTGYRPWHPHCFFQLEPINKKSNTGAF